MRVIDSLDANGYGPLDYRLGGGTVLMLRFDHRLSKDIDIFTHDARALSFITPRLNAATEREAADYVEQANLVKLTLRDGATDFIVAAPVLPGSDGDTLDFEGRAIRLDSTAEILAKKLLYRADTFKARDVFDMAAALAADRPSALAALRATVRTRPALTARLGAMDAAPPGSLARGIVMTERGAVHAAGMIAALRQAIREVDGCAG